jgi:DNA-binding transcriptional regulator YiaG
VTPVEIKAARKSIHLTQAQLAAKLGVTVTTVSRWETDGESSPQPGHMERLMKIIKGEDHE